MIRYLAAAAVYVAGATAPLGSARAQDGPVYAGSAACADCHADEMAAWEGSHHDLAWTETTDGAVLGNFDGTEFAHDGTLTRFDRDGDALSITVTEADGRSMTRPVHSVVGIAPLQQYLMETEPGRLQSFDVVWDTGEERWYHLYPDQDLPPEDGLHWTGPYKTWNARCAECHATGYEKNYDPQSRSYSSVQAEIGVGCEACHGPASAHLDWAAGREVTMDGLGSTGLTVDLAEGGEVLIQQCATCHARREPFSDGSPVPGTPFHDAYRLSLLRPGLYHADGQIRDEVYVYGSFLQSKMYARGVTCMNCHEPHSAQTVAEGNALCTQCHSEAGNDDFPSLPLAEYDSPAHHHHPEGAECKSCHMIERVYMGVDGRRDHSFRVPRPDLSQRFGTPNACTDCHADEGADWAARQVEEWYPESRHRGPHFAEVLTASSEDPAQARLGLIGLAMDDTQPGIVRATALEMLTAAPDPETAGAVTELLEADDPLVRAQAIAVQRGAPDQDRVLRLLPMLDDPARAVRIAAARALIDAPIARLPQSSRAAMDRAMSEWRRSLAVNADFPETQMALAGVALSTRNLAAADAAFAEVVALDPQMVDAWVMRARIAAAGGDRAATVRLLQDALRANPGQPLITDMLYQITEGQ